MTVDYSYVAAFDVKAYLWSQLQSAGLLDANDYFPDGFSKPLVPIFPSQEIPEMNNLLPGKTYITYDIEQKPIGESWWIAEETMMLQIVSRSNSEILAIINFLTDTFRRFDKSAFDVNSFIHTYNSPFKFFNFRLETANPVQPFKDEGGFMSGDFSFVYTYTRSLSDGIDNNGRYI